MREQVLKTTKDTSRINAESDDYPLQIARVKNIMNEALTKLDILQALPRVLENDGMILKQFLSRAEADYIMMLAENGLLNLTGRPDLVTMQNHINKISMVYKPKVDVFKRKSEAERRRKSSTPTPMAVDYSYQVKVAYAVDIVFKCKPLIEFMSTIKEHNPDPFIESFEQVLAKLKEIADYRLSVSAREEIQREKDLKLSYRTLTILNKNIEDLEEQLVKQRQELSTEHERQTAIINSLDKKLGEIKEKARMDISRIVYESETKMMKDYNKSVDLQVDLAEEAQEATDHYKRLLEDHIDEEKGLRAKRFKVQAQLASWLAKYDQDISEKQSEYEKLEELYNKEKDDYDKLMEDYEKQEEVYLKLMAEKEAEETRINNEKAWIFLQNRSARRIQRCWRAFRARKLAKRRRGKKEKKTKKEKKSGKVAGKKKEPDTSLKGGPDPNALLESKFDSELLADIKDENAFEQKDVVVDL